MLYSNISRLRTTFGSLRGVIHSVPKRNAGIVYRGAALPSRKQHWRGEIVSAAMWFWILWRFYHDPEEMLGHFPYPEPSKWTDAELGIPPDDED